MGSGSLASLANNRCGLRMQLFSDTQTQATGVPLASVECAPAYLSSVSYKFPTEGNFTEDVTLVSNDKTWATGTAAAAVTDSVLATGSPSDQFGILRRGQWSKNSILPNSGAVSATVSGVISSSSGGIPSGSKINNVTVSMNLGREQIRELGSRTPFYRYIKFPVEVTTEIEVTANTGDMVGVSAGASGCSNPKALTNKQIVIKLCDGTTLDLGSKNKLTSVNFTGGDTGGSNASITYSYTTYSEFTYTPPTGTAGVQGAGQPLSYLDPSGIIESGLPVAGTDY
jgi:hypothetical protein